MHDADHRRRFAELVEAHLPMIRRVCLAYLYDRGAADDLCQEVLLNVWRNWARFEGRATWSTYLYRITVNTVISHNRRERGGVLPLSGVETQIDESARALSEKDSEEQRLDALQQAISRLCPADRVLMSLVLEDLSYQQIGEILGLTPGHVGVRINRCKEKLRKSLLP